MTECDQPGPDPTGLYDPRDERDSCGFGLIAQLDDRPSRATVDAALEALARMTHRGGVAADGLSGDGCGLLLKHPERFLRTLAKEAGFAVGSQFAAGLVFLPHDETQAARCRDTLRKALAEVQLAVAGWRTLPVAADACGATARSTMPRIEQVFAAPLIDVEGARPTPKPSAARCSWPAAAPPSACRTYRRSTWSACPADSIGYKGMVLPQRLPQLFPDLQRTELESSAVVFHQRFSTNTLPRWPLAHPFRLLAHNGEINTIDGNRALGAGARKHVWRTPALDIARIRRR